MNSAGQLQPKHARTLLWAPVYTHALCSIIISQHSLIRHSPCTWTQIIYTLTVFLI